MDDRRFDDVARRFAVGGSRRQAVRGLVGLAGMLTLARFNRLDATARRGTSGPGDPCRHDDQCAAADTALVCAWNGYGHDGDWNCCTFEGGRCANDRGCCGYSDCVGGFCGPDFSGRTSISGSGGIASADAGGGAIYAGDINSGGNVGNIIDVGNTAGAVSIDGGYVSNETDVSLSADGGTAIADASGGSYNVAGGPGGYYDQSGQYVGPNCDDYPLGGGCDCWQGPGAPNPCDGSMVCCRAAGNSGVCLELPQCTGWYGPGENCPGYCDWGSGCPSCTTGYCNWSGYCDWD